MFCPVGYHSAAELWDEFLEHRFEDIYIDAVRGYNSPSFEPAFTRGSPIDICEHIFLKVLSLIGVYVAAPDQRVMRIHVRMDDGLPSLFYTGHIYECASYAAAVKADIENIPGRELIENANFVSWDGKPTDREKMSKVYLAASDLDDFAKQDSGWDVRHHTLLNHLHRHSYTIAAVVPIWGHHTYATPQVGPLVDNFAGWSLCIDDRTHAEKWPEYLIGRKEIYPKGDQNNTVSQVGRPRLNAAFKAFAAMEFDKGDLTWEQVARRIERETSEKPSHKSLRNWRDENSNKQ